MQPKFWEGIVKFLDRYWWIILIVVVIGLVLYFTRNLWGSALGLFF